MASLAVATSLQQLVENKLVRWGQEQKWGEACAVAGVWVISYTDLGYGGDQEKMSDSDYFVGSVGRI